MQTPNMHATALRARRSRRPDHGTVRLRQDHAGAYADRSFQSSGAVLRGWSATTSFSCGRGGRILLLCSPGDRRPCRGPRPRPAAAAEHGRRCDDLVVRLVPTTAAERLPDAATETIAGCGIASARAWRKPAHAASLRRGRLVSAATIPLDIRHTLKNASIWPIPRKIGLVNRPSRRQDSALAVRPAGTSSKMSPV